MKKLKNDFYKYITNSKAIFIEVCTQNGKTIDYNIVNGYFTEWTKGKIKKAFNFNNGKTKDFLQYADDNKKLAEFYII